MKSFFATLLFAALPLVARADFDIAGEWGSYDNAGLSSVVELSGGTCVLRAIEERRYRFYRLTDVPTIRHGVYAVMSHLRWVYRTSEKCAAPNQKPESMYITLRTWDLNVETMPNSADFKVTAKFSSCVGVYCNVPGLFKGDFSATLTAQAGQIIDAGDGQNVGRLTFTPLAELQKKSYLIVSHFLEKLQALEPSDESSFVDGMIDPQLVGRYGKSTIVTKLHQYYLERLQGGSTYDVIEAYYMPEKTSPFISPPVVYATVAHKPVSGEARSENIELLWSNGSWRLIGIP
jgi:hypothetical protein